MPGEENQKSLTDFICVCGAYVSLAMVAHIVRIGREHAGDTQFSWSRFSIGMASAALVGAVTGWLLESIGVKSMELRAAIVSCTGYVGGPLLDIAYKEMIEVLQAGFDGFEKWLAEARWSKRKDD